MKTMKSFSRNLILGMVFLSLLLPVVAQGPNGPHQGPRDMEHLKSELGLTDEQATQFEKLRTSHHQQMRALKNAEGEPDREQMKTLRKQHRQQMQDILSKEQMDKLKEMPRPRHRQDPETKAKRKAMKKEIRPLLKQQRIKLESSLTGAEKAEIEKIRTDLKMIRPELKSLRAEKRTAKEAGQKPTEAQKAKRQELKAQKDAMIEKAMAIGKAHEAEIMSLYEEIKPEMEAIHAKHDVQPKHKRGMSPLAKFILINPNKKAGKQQQEIELEDF